MADMDISFQKSKESQYGNFLTITKWAVIAIILTLSLMAIFLL